MEENEDDKLCQALLAVKGKDKSTLERIVLSGIDVNKSIGKDGNTLLVEAVTTKQLDLVMFLIENGADINQGDGLLVTPLCGAAAVNDITMASLLLSRGCDITKLVDGRPLQHVITPLHYTIMNYNPQMAKLLLDAGHDPNFPSAHCKYPLTETIVHNTPAITKLLIECDKCHVDQIKNLYGSWDFPALHQALFRYRRYDIAKMLLDSKRCRLHFDLMSYLSFLMMNCFDRSYRKLVVAKMLLEAGCDMINVDREGNKPFTTLLLTNNNIFNITSMMSLMKLLINHGVRPNMEDVECLKKYIKNEEEKLFVKSLEELLNTPMTLQEICRKHFRLRFGIYPQDKLKMLPLPEKLIGYLTMEDVKVYYDEKDKHRI